MRKGDGMTRRNFISTLTFTAAGGIIASPLGGTLFAQDAKTIQSVIDLLIAAANSGIYPMTVDTVKSSNADQPVKGVVTTFMANADVIKKTINLGANLIVTHEPTYYNHEDKTEWLEKDDVYKYKRQLLEDNKIVIFRYHDYMHSIKPDPVVTAVTNKLRWQKYVNKEDPRLCTIPSQKLSALAKEIKMMLGAESVRFVGSPDMSCSKIGLLVGASGGTSHINMMSTIDIDVLVVGEIHEWETSEYVRDAIASGKNKAVIIAGHAPTEEPGMQWLAQWLQPKLPSIKISHLPGVSPFKYV